MQEIFDKIPPCQIFGPELSAYTEGYSAFLPPGSALFLRRILPYLPSNMEPRPHGDQWRKDEAKSEGCPGLTVAFLSLVVGT